MSQRAESTRDNVCARLRAFVELLSRWRRTSSFVSEASFASVWSRHIADSAQLRRFAPSAKTWVDIGTGGGFPGLVLAICLSNLDVVVHCIESNQRKCAFLREAIRATKAPVILHTCDVGGLTVKQTGQVDAVTARAFASPPATLAAAEKWLVQGALGIFPMGRSARDDFTVAGRTSGYDIEFFVSVVERPAYIARVHAKTRCIFPLIGDGPLPYGYSP